MRLQGTGQNRGWILLGLVLIGIVAAALLYFFLIAPNA